MSHGKTLSRGDKMPSRKGYRAVVLTGRNYPLPQLAIDRLRRTLAKDGIDVPEEDIGPILSMPKAFCPYSAWALIPERKD